MTGSVNDRSSMQTTGYNVSQEANIYIGCMVIEAKGLGVRKQRRQIKIA